MSRKLPYIVLFLTAVLLQILIFDQLSASIYFAPLVYVLFLVLMPVESSQIVMLSTGVALGVVMDCVMGTHGLNSIATIFVAYSRRSIIDFIVGRERSADRGVPSEVSFGAADFIIYLSIVIALHHLVFFLFESLSLAYFLRFLWRFLLSTSVSIFSVWLIARFFTTNKFLK